MDAIYRHIVWPDNLRHGSPSFRQGKGFVGKQRIISQKIGPTAAGGGVLDDFPSRDQSV